MLLLIFCHVVLIVCILCGKSTGCNCLGPYHSKISCKCILQLTTFSLILKRLHESIDQILEVLINNSLNLMWDFYMYYMYMQLCNSISGSCSLCETKLLAMPLVRMQCRTPATAVQYRCMCSTQLKVHAKCAQGSYVFFGTLDILFKFNIN